MAAITIPDHPLPADQPYYSTDLLLARHAAQRRRAAAMIATHDTILGLRFHPLTPASFSRLVLIESPFLWRTKGAANPAAVRDYLWNHWPGFDADGENRDTFQKMLTRHISPPWLRLAYSIAAWNERPAAAYALAAEAIYDLVGVAFADEPAPRTGSGRIVCASLEAVMIDLFAERYRWEPERTRHTPFRQLFQYIRCNDTSDYAPDEVAIIADDLRRDNEQAAALRNLSPA